MAYVYNSQLDAFTLYHIQHEERRDPIGPALPALGHATSGAAGTAISKLLTYPLDLVITRLQAQKQLTGDAKDFGYSGVQDAIEKIYNEEGGIAAFYSGVLPEVMKGVADSFLFFLAYTYARQKRLTSQGTRSLSALDEIGVGVLAGALSKFWTTPIQNIVTRKQTATMVAARDPRFSVLPSLTVKDIAQQIRSEKGVQGFWSGYSASLVLTLNPSITFLLHRLLLRYLVPSSKQLNPGARITFLLAAVSKAIALTVTYPFSLAKTRAQISSQSPSDASATSESEKPEDVIKAKVARAKQRTVFSTILQIAQTEGLGALYDGLGAEVLKGFFSHGITMLIKNRIHSVIINLYYLILRSLKQYPSPEELANKASNQAKEAYQQGKDQIEGVYARGVEITGNASAKVQDAASTGRSQAEGLLERGKESATNATKQVKAAIIETNVDDINGGKPVKE
ncbi:mitochondrial carrier domain-containing protein [Massariosphaeria phaeospora]|uniref:Mitochondrial carrier domain-containing protein n=1 Tax=Massariosphaeria phaeospora TaxID=100035 RepID=A0A7C8MAF8_9PLEO|nr:mitochondrial carrier domain-containing protein [Massariosphaeria phaeospora]